MFKKYYFAMFFLFVMLMHNNFFAMDLAIVEQNELSPEQDYKCYWVANYLHKNAKKLDQQQQQNVNAFFEKNNALSQRVQFYQKSMDESDQEVINFFQKLSEGQVKPEDCSTLSLGASYRIEYFLEQRLFLFCVTNHMQGGVFADIADAMRSLDNKYDLASFFLRKITVESRHPLTDSYANMYAQSYLGQQGWKKQKRKIASITELGTLQFQVRRDDDARADALERGSSESLCDDLFDDIYEDYFTIQCDFQFFFTTIPYMPLLSKICEGSTENRKRINALGHKLTSDEMQDLRNLHKKVNESEEWKALQKVGIDIDFVPTRWQRFKDRMLLAMPLFLVEGIVPTAIGVGLQQSGFGKVVQFMGIMPCAYVSKLIGNNIFPWFDMRNSGVSKLRTIFGDNGVRKIQRGNRFMFYGIGHYLATIMSQYFLSQYSGYVSTSVGLGLYLCRLGVYLYDVMSTKYSDKDGDADTFGKMMYANPLLRRNREGKYFTLGDLVNSLS